MQLEEHRDWQRNMAEALKRCGSQLAEFDVQVEQCMWRVSSLRVECFVWRLIVRCCGQDMSLVSYSDSSVLVTIRAVKDNPINKRQAQVCLETTSPAWPATDLTALRCVCFAGPDDQAVAVQLGRAHSQRCVRPLAGSCGLAIAIPCSNFDWA